MKIYEKAKDKNVAVTVIYANSSNNLFYDPEFTKSVNLASDGLELFLKGCVALKGTTYYAPLNCTSSGVITFNFPG